MAEENKLALNLEALKETRLFYRDDKVSQILLSISSGINTFVFGATGTGKTTVVNHAMKKFNDSRNQAIYINCTTRQTEYAILSEIIEQINSGFANRILFIQTRSNCDLVKYLEKNREKFPKVKVIVLDHLQGLEEPKVVESLLEIGFTLILVSDEPKAINRLSAPANSKFANTVKFEEYTQENIVKILDSKARHLLGDGHYKESLVAKIAELSHGNIGYGESLLVASAIVALNLKKEHVDENDVPVLHDGVELSYDERIILDILREQNSIQGGRLYQMYCQRTKFPKAERTFRNYMRNLCEKNFVKAIGTNKGRVYEVLKKEATQNTGEVSL